MKHFEVFTGRVGRIGELKEFGDNGCVLNFSVAESLRKKNNQTQQWEDVATIWTEVTLFGDEARNFLRSVKPGTFVTVVGTRTAREYTPKDSTEKRTIQSVVADQVSVAITKFNFIEGIGSVGGTGGRSGGSSSGGNNNTQSQPASQGTGSPSSNADPFASTDPFANSDPFASDGDNPFEL